MTQRWVFAEVGTANTWTVPLNPDSMSSPIAQRTLTSAFAAYQGSPRTPSTMMRTPASTQWEFSGVIRTKAHHDDLIAWCRKPGKVRITDHLGRTFEVMISDIEIADRRPTPNTPWRLRYTVTASILRRIA